MQAGGGVPLPNLWWCFRPPEYLLAPPHPTTSLPSAESGHSVQQYHGHGVSTVRIRAPCSRSHPHGAGSGGVDDYHNRRSSLSTDRVHYHIKSATPLAVPCRVVYMECQILAVGGTATTTNEQEERHERRSATGPSSHRGHGRPSPSHPSPPSPSQPQQQHSFVHAFHHDAAQHAENSNSSPMLHTAAQATTVPLSPPPSLALGICREQLRRHQLPGEDDHGIGLLTRQRMIYRHGNTDAERVVMRTQPVRLRRLIAEHVGPPWPGGSAAATRNAEARFDLGNARANQHMSTKTVQQRQHNSSVSSSSSAAVASEASSASVLPVRHCDAERKRDMQHVHDANVIQGTLDISVGDVVGCLVNFVTQTVCFTLNGKLLSHRSTLDEEVPLTGYYMAVGLQHGSPAVLLRVVFRGGTMDCAGLYQRTGLSYTRESIDRDDSRSTVTRHKDPMHEIMRSGSSDASNGADLLRKDKSSVSGDGAGLGQLSCSSSPTRAAHEISANKTPGGQVADSRFTTSTDNPDRRPHAMLHQDELGPHQPDAALVSDTRFDLVRYTRQVAQTMYAKQNPTHRPWGVSWQEATMRDDAVEALLTDYFASRGMTRSLQTMTRELALLQSESVSLRSGTPVDNPAGPPAVERQGGYYCDCSRRNDADCSCVRERCHARERCARVGWSSALGRSTLLSITRNLILRPHSSNHSDEDSLDDGRGGVSVLQTRAGSRALHHLGSNTLLTQQMCEVITSLNPLHDTDSHHHANATITCSTTNIKSNDTNIDDALRDDMAIGGNDAYSFLSNDCRSTLMFFARRQDVLFALQALHVVELCFDAVERELGRVVRWHRLCEEEVEAESEAEAAEHEQKKMKACGRARMKHGTSFSRGLQAAWHMRAMTASSSVSTALLTCVSELLVQPFVQLGAVAEGFAPVESAVDVVAAMLVHPLSRKKSSSAPFSPSSRATNAATAALAVEQPGAKKNECHNRPPAQGQNSPTQEWEKTRRTMQSDCATHADANVHWSDEALLIPAACLPLMLPEVHMTTGDVARAQQRHRTVSATHVRGDESGMGELTLSDEDELAECDYGNSDVTYALHLRCRAQRLLKKRLQHRRCVASLSPTLCSHAAAVSSLANVPCPTVVHDCSRSDCNNAARQVCNSVGRDAIDVDAGNPDNTTNKDEDDHSGRVCAMCSTRAKESAKPPLCSAQASPSFSSQMDSPKSNTSNKCNNGNSNSSDNTSSRIISTNYAQQQEESYLTCAALLITASTSWVPCPSRAEVLQFAQLLCTLCTQILTCVHQISISLLTTHTHKPSASVRGGAVYNNKEKHLHTSSFDHVSSHDSHRSNSSNSNEDGADDTGDPSKRAVDNGCRNKNCFASPRSDMSVRTSGGISESARTLLCWIARWHALLCQARRRYRTEAWRRFYTTVSETTEHAARMMEEILRAHGAKCHTCTHGTTLASHVEAKDTKTEVTATTTEATKVTATDQLTKKGVSLQPETHTSIHAVEDAHLCASSSFSSTLSATHSRTLSCNSATLDSGPDNESEEERARMSTDFTSEEDEDEFIYEENSEEEEQQLRATLIGSLRTRDRRSAPLRPLRLENTGQDNSSNNNNDNASSNNNNHNDDDDGAGTDEDENDDDNEWSAPSSNQSNEYNEEDEEEEEHDAMGGGVANTSEDEEEDVYVNYYAEMLSQQSQPVSSAANFVGHSREHNNDDNNDNRNHATTNTTTAAPFVPTSTYSSSAAVSCLPLSHYYYHRCDYRSVAALHRTTSATASSSVTFSTEQVASGREPHAHNSTCVSSLSSPPCRDACPSRILPPGGLSLRALWRDCHTMAALEPRQQFMSAAFLAEMAASMGQQHQRHHEEEEDEGRMRLDQETDYALVTRIPLLKRERKECEVCGDGGVQCDEESGTEAPYDWMINELAYSSDCVSDIYKYMFY